MDINLFISLVYGSHETHTSAFTYYSDTFSMIQTDSPQSSFSVQHVTSQIKVLPVVA